MSQAITPTIRVQNVRQNRLQRKLWFFGGLALLLILASFFSDYLCPYDPYLQDMSLTKAAPSAEHLLGTDRYGRDMLSRVIAGSKTSIFSTLLLVGFISIFGTMIGVLCAQAGRWLDTLLMRTADKYYCQG